jgi:dihydrofolate synthase/folylpolyglutamate synthase
MPRTLTDWLVHIGQVHGRSIELGLDRIETVARALGAGARAPIIVVGGTNGKGSTCAMIDSVLRSAGYGVGLYTSPHLLHFNERIRVNGAPVCDESLCRAFERIEQARGAVPLTYFEFATLAAWLVFASTPLDAVILEVGLGGRLDAVNAFDADCAVLSSIAIDHVEYLGGDRERIGQEKSGIFRPGRPAIIADPHPPASVVDHARAVGAVTRLIGRDFGFVASASQWQYWSRRGEALTRRSGLAYPALRGKRQLFNAAAAMAAIESLADRLPVAMQDFRGGLIGVEWPGRFQVLPGRPAVVLDVAHNAQAVEVLAENLGDMGFYPVTWAVFGMMRDKDIAAAIDRVRARIDRWLVASLPPPRGASAGELRAALDVAGIGPAQTFDSPASAFAHAREHAGGDDRIVAFGSFLTVADVMRSMSA